ncbi:MAG: ISNCY family transposase, partial [bacterium]
MDDLSTLTEREMVRWRVIQEACSQLTVGKAARMLGLSIRQAFRLKARYKDVGAKGLAHGNRGRRPANAKPEALRNRVLELFKQEFAGYNTPHFAEALVEEYGIALNEETLRRWLRRAGFKPKHRHNNRSNHRRCRTREPRFGMMLFLDGSPHPWLGPSRPKLTLILCTDDATGRPLWGKLYPQETLAGCFEVLYQVFQQYGLPQCLYLDRAGQFTTTRHGGTVRLQADTEPTAFEIAMQELTVEPIFANSPQARGRGERINRSFQDRLTVELAHHRITTVEAANRYINDTFIPRYAERFGVPPADPTSAFRRLPANRDLRTVLCRKSTRQVTSDNTISYLGRRYQLLPTSRSVCVRGSTV